MFARFDENPAMTLRVIKETKHYGRTDARTDARTDNVKTVYPLQTKFARGYKNHILNCTISLIVGSVYCCLVVTCWERADLLALVCDV